MMAMNGANKIEIRDVQGLLRKYLNQDLIMVDYQAKHLLPKGENYASTILQLDVKLKKTEDAPIEELNLVAKMMQATNFHDKYFNSTLSVIKEIFVYEELIPRYRKLEKEVLEKSLTPDFCSVLPKFYGGRLSLNSESKVADLDSVILMENLRVQGYEVMDRKQGLDFEHTRKAMKLLARYHALGIAIRSKDPSFFQRAMIPMKPPVLNLSNDFENVIEYTKNSVCSDPRIAKYTKSISEAFKNGWEAVILNIPENPWFTFTHGDFWVNNLLYLHDEDGSIKDMKLIDFQFPTYTVCMADIPYMACCSTRPEVLENNFDTLLDEYYEDFVNILKDMGCYSDVYSRSNFDAELKKVANCQLFNCIVGIKFFTFDLQGDFDLNDVMSVVLLAEVTDLFRDRIFKLITKFAEKGWL